MRYAIIENEIIINVITADEEVVALTYPDAIICPDEFGVGDRYSDGQFTRVTTSIPVEEVNE